MKNVGSDVGRAVGAGVGTEVGAAVGTFVAKEGVSVGFDVGTVVSSSRRAPSRRPLDRRAFGPLRGGRCCPHANALSSAHRPRRSMLVCPCGPGVRGSVDRQPKQLQALPISACCALACPGLSRACSPWIAGVGRGNVRVVRARLAGHRSGRGEFTFRRTPPTTPSSRSRHKYCTKERYIQQVRVDDRRGEGSYRRVDRGRRGGRQQKERGTTAACSSRSGPGRA